jgi:cellulose synthase/poly-beta-1,6-N-acetylglucosamine synthase-like glycosyltransferase
LLIDLVGLVFGLWRKDVIFEQGGFSTQTSTEDIEMTFGLHDLFRNKKGDYSIITMPDPVTWTEVPSSFGDLFRQRERWQRAMIETFFKYKKMLLNPRFGSVGMFGMPYYFLYEILGPFVEIYGYGLIFIAIFYRLINIQEFFLFIVVSVGFSALISLFALFLEQYDYNTFTFWELPKLILLAITEFIWYRQFTDLARITATFNVLRGKKDWRSPERKGKNEF